MSSINLTSGDETEEVVVVPPTPSKERRKRKSSGEDEGIEHLKRIEEGNGSV